MTYIVHTVGIPSHTHIGRGKANRRDSACQLLQQSAQQERKPGVRGVAVWRATTRNEAAAELDRMQSKKPGTKS